jgi:hypothetical protein
VNLDVTARHQVSTFVFQTFQRLFQSSNGRVKDTNEQSDSHLNYPESRS